MHVVTPEVDKGFIVHSERVEILPYDTVDDLQQRVLPVEHKTQIDGLRRFARAELKTQPKRERPLVESWQVPHLIDGKKVARILYPKG